MLVHLRKSLITMKTNENVILKLIGRLQFYFTSSTIKKLNRSSENKTKILKIPQKILTKLLNLLEIPNIFRTV